MAEKLHLYIDCGTDYNKRILLYDSNNNPLNVTNCSARSFVKKHYESNSSLFEFDVLLSNGYIELNLSSNATINIEGGKYLYDIEFTDSSNNISRLKEGFVYCNSNITK